MHVRPVYKYESFIDFAYAIQIRNRVILWQVRPILMWRKILTWRLSTL